jgi:hypothetical protein
MRRSSTGCCSPGNGAAGITAHASSKMVQACVRYAVEAPKSNSSSLLQKYLSNTRNSTVFNSTQGTPNQQSENTNTNGKTAVSPISTSAISGKEAHNDFLGTALAAWMIHDILGRTSEVTRVAMSLTDIAACMFHISWYVKSYYVSLGGTPGVGL